MTTVAIVGAGPAGLRAAEVLVAAGLRPVLVDEAPRVGGQVYRQPHPALKRPLKAMYGAQAGAASALFARWLALQPQVDHRPDTLVWQVEDRRLHLLSQGRPDTLAFDALVLATGATDRVMPFPGWTLPGVFTLGGAQVLLKSQAMLLGPRIVFAGSGPLLYLVASQYVKAGAQVAGVLDTAPADARRRALAGLLARPRMAAVGASLLLKLRLAGVPVHRHVRLVAAEGDERVQALRWHDGTREHRLAVDAIAFGHGLRSETQLADLAGCAFAFDAVEQAWLPTSDGDGRSSVRGVYLAGDGALLRGADAAELAGARAAQALLHDLRGTALPPASAELASHGRWRVAMAALSEPPADWAAQAPDDLVVCRCEQVTAGELRTCAAATGAREMNRLKAFSRIGMGRCQGRMCGASAARLLAQANGCELSTVGRLRAQPPVKPVPVSALASAIDHAPPAPPEESDD